MDILIKMLLGVGLAGAVGGPYILYLAYFRPQIFAKPALAKKQGAVAFVVGVVIFAAYILFLR